MTFDLDNQMISSAFSLSDNTTLSLNNVIPSSADDSYLLLNSSLMQITNYKKHDSQ